MKHYIMAKIFISLMLLPAVAIPQEKPTAQVILSGAIKPILGEWNFGVCGPEDFSTFHAQITDGHQTFAFSMTGPDAVEAMGAGSLRFDFRQVTIRDNGDVQYILTHSFVNPTTKKLTVESEIDENLYNGHLLGVLLSLPDKVSDNQDPKDGADFYLLFATQGNLDQLPSFTESGLALCKSMRTVPTDAANQLLLDWADGKSIPAPVLPPAQKPLPSLPPTKTPFPNPPKGRVA